MFGEAGPNDTVECLTCIFKYRLYLENLWTLFTDTTYWLI